MESPQEEPPIPEERELPPHTVELLIPSERLFHVVQEIADRITRDYADSGRRLLLVGILNGAMRFVADLVRGIGRPVEYDFVALSSYGARTETSGTVRTLKGLSASVAGKDVLIVDDILDTGLTLRGSGLLERIEGSEAASVKVCVLLDKPARRLVEVPIDYKGFEIEDRFVVGYGLDYGERYRDLDYIGAVVFSSSETPS